MDTRDFVLAAMSPAGSDPFSPVHVQKLFFLLDQNIADYTEGPHFAFVPYDYGPFDKDVYLCLATLQTQGDVHIARPGPYSIRTYSLTAKGCSTGRHLLKGLPQNIQHYIRDLVAAVRSLSFAELVSTIYRQYPEMRVNSVFSENY